MISCFGDLYFVNLTPFFSVRFSQKKFFTFSLSKRQKR